MNTIEIEIDAKSGLRDIMTESVRQHMQSTLRRAAQSRMQIADAVDGANPVLVRLARYFAENSESVDLQCYRIFCECAEMLAQFGIFEAEPVRNGKLGYEAHVSNWRAILEYERLHAA